MSVYRFWILVSDVVHLVKLMNTEKDHQIAETESKHARQRLHFQLPIQQKHIRTENTQINIISHGLTSSTSPKHCGILLTENGKKGRNIQRKALDVHVYYFLKELQESSPKRVCLS